MRLKQVLQYQELLLEKNNSMTKLKIISPLGFILCLGIFFTNCERDDICAAGTSTTPRLIIQFFDDEIRSETKTVTNLKVQSTIEGSEAFFDLNTTDSIAIPLNTEAINTEFQFVSNSGDETEENIDIISFQYTTEEEYVSSACGFKVVYKGLTKTDPDSDTDTDIWIKEINIQQSDVLDESTTHVYIYH